MGIIRSNLTIVTCSKSDVCGLRVTLKSLNAFLSDLPQIILVLSQYSDDEIKEVIQEFSTFELQIIHAQPNGIYEAQNLGLNSVQTKFTLILNGGDSLTSVEAVRNLINKIGDKSWGYGEARIIDSIRETSYLYNFRRYSPLLHRLGIKYVPHPASIVNTHIAKSIGGFDQKYRIAADQKMLLTFASKSPPEITHEVVANFYTGGVSARSAEQIVSDFRAISHEIYGNLFRSEFLDRKIWRMVLILRKLKDAIR
jgi:hypothetical protein